MKLLKIADTAVKPSVVFCGRSRPERGSDDVDSGASTTDDDDDTEAISTPLAKVLKTMELNSIPTCEGYNAFS